MIGDGLVNMKFHKDVLKNISEFQRYEWMETNALGSYASSSISGMNLRRNQGLLIVPHNSGKGKVVTLSKFEETVFVENRLFEISTNQYLDTIYPHGYQYQEKFELNPFPSFVYRIEDRRVRKTLFLLEQENVLAVRYELLNQGRPVTLVIKPFIAVRFNDELNREIQGLNTDTYQGNSFVRWAPRPEMPELYIYFKKGEFITATLWYHGFIYPKDYDRFGISKEDLFNPGFFQVELKPYEKFDLFVSTKDMNLDLKNFEELYYQENQRRKKKLFNFKNSSSAIERISLNFERAFLFRDNKVRIHIDFMSSKKNLRFFLFCLPIYIQKTNSLTLFKNTIEDILKYMDSGLLPVNYPLDNEKPVYNQADLGLWLIYLLYLYFKQYDDLEFLETIYEKLRVMVEAFIKGTTFNIYADRDGLVFVGDRTINVSWIPVKKQNGEVLRYGKLLEVNALWYNALKIMEHFGILLKKKRYVNKYQKLASKVKQNFVKVFGTKDKIGLYDFVHQDVQNNDFRINQIIPLALPFSALDDDYAAALLKRIEEELLTPYGLRSQSIYDSGYRKGDLKDGDEGGDFYAGAVWPWSVSLFVQAKLKYSQKPQEVQGLWRNYFRPLLELTEEGVLGYIPEGLHFNERLNPLGSEDFVPALASVMWSEFLLNEEK